MPALAIIVMSFSTMPFSFSQYASVPATSRNGRPEENPNSSMVHAAGWANDFQTDGLARVASFAGRFSPTASVGIINNIRRVIGEPLVAVDRAVRQPVAQ